MHADRFDFTMLSETQHDGMFEKSKIEGVKAYVVLLFASYQRAFLIDIQDIVKLEEEGTKSLNIKKIDKWTIPYIELKTIPSRKELLDYDPDQEIF